MLMPKITNYYTSKYYLCGETILYKHGKLFLGLLNYINSFKSIS